MFRGCKQEDMPPHVYAVAQHAHRELLSNRIDQSILLLGRSGSGKTTNARHLLQYLILASGSVNNYLTGELKEKKSIFLLHWKYICQFVKDREKSKWDSFFKKNISILSKFKSWSKLLTFHFMLMP